MDILYPIKSLATGGAIGNSLFFMLSSYGLYLSYGGKGTSFLQYFKRRITKLYPNVWAELIILFIPFSIFIDQVLLDSKFFFSYLSYFVFPYHHWFLACLLIYYIIIFPLLKRYKTLLVILLIFLSLSGYTYIYIEYTDLSKWTIEATSVRYFSYFLLFLSGIIFARYNDRIKYKGYRDWLLLLFFIGLLYFQKFLLSKQIYLHLQFIQQILLFPIVFFFLKVSNTPIITDHIMGSHFLSRIINNISEITLQLYMVHGYFIIIVATFKIIFPINVLLVMILSLLSAIFMRSVANRIITAK